MIQLAMTIIRLAELEKQGKLTPAEKVQLSAARSEITAVTTGKKDIQFSDPFGLLAD